jgi:hypothetical protein
MRWFKWAGAVIGLTSFLMVTGGIGCRRYEVATCVYEIPETDLQIGGDKVVVLVIDTWTGKVSRDKNSEPLSRAEFIKTH